MTRRRFMAGGLTVLAGAGQTAASYARVRGANERIGVGFIGYGLIGKRHVADFQREANVACVALSDVHRGRQEQGLAVLAGDARGYTDFRRLLEDRRVDAVVISTPDHWHALQTMLACDAGKDVYVEKPLTLFQREGQWMQQVASRTQRVVQVGTQQRSGLHYQRARDLMRGGKLGQIHAVRTASARNIGEGFGRQADTHPPQELDWNLWLGPAPWRAYNPQRAIYHFRWYWDYSGGQMTNLGSHQLDIVDWVLGLDGLRIVSSIGSRYVVRDGGETPDTQDALFDCGRFSLTWSLREASRGSTSGFGLEFFGTNGQLGISRSGFKLDADPAIPAANLIPGIGDHPVGGPAKVDLAPGSPRALRTDAIEDLTGSSDEQYRRHVRDFLECVRTRSTPVSDLASAHRTSTACHLANLSLRLQRQLRWDAQREQVLNDEEASAMLTRPYRAPWDAELRSLHVQ